MQENNNLIVCLKNGAIRIYNEKNLVSNIETNVGANGIIFGMYGREEGCLVINSASGGMMAKIMKRKANLTAPQVKAGPPPEQDIPLKVPTKTTLFVELTQREREQGPGKY